MDNPSKDFKPNSLNNTHSSSPDKQAVGLKYTGNGAPIVTAKGQGYVAEQILAIAKEHNIPISENADLVGMLAQVELDQEIPEVLYEAVVQVLLFAYNLSGKKVPTSETTN